MGMPQIPRKVNNRPAINFYGFDSGSWFETDEYLLSSKQYNWSMVSGLTARYGGNIYHIEGATENHPGFLDALGQIITKYPELSDYYLEFDGPPIKAGQLLTNAPKIKFLHGTTTAVWPQIQQYGLQPRSMTGLPATYGYQSSALPGRPDAIYLTTQLHMARFAARDAVKIHGGDPLILQISDIDWQYAIPDVDSRAATAKESLQKLGSIGYLTSISPGRISQYRSNPDEPHRRYERAYQADPTLDHLVAFNRSSHRAGFSLQPFFEDYLSWLKEPDNWLGRSVPFPPKQLVQQARILSSGCRQTRQGEDHYVDRTVLQLSIFPNTFNSRWDYRINIKYKSKQNILVVKCKFLHEVIARIEIAADGIAQILSLVPANTDLGHIVLAERTQSILDPREIPQTLFSEIKDAIRLKDEVYRDRLRTLNELPADLVNYLRFLNDVHGKISRNTFLDSYLIDNHPFRVTNRLFQTLLRPESGVPQFSRIEGQIVADGNYGYAFQLKLYYTEMVVETPDNVRRAEQFSEQTQTDYFETPTEVATAVQQQLLRPQIFPSTPEWKCHAEVDDFDGIAIDVTIHCRIGLSPQFLIRLIQNY